MILLLLLITIVNEIMAQRSRQAFSHANLQGVERFGVSINYFDNYVKGGAVEYLRVGRNHNYNKYTLQYRERETETEQSQTLHLQFTHGSFMGQVGSRFFGRWLFGPEIGYEMKESLLIEETRDFFFAGFHVGWGFEYFLTRRVILHASAMQYGHFYLQNVRTDWLLNGGVRISLH